MRRSPVTKNPMKRLRGQIPGLPDGIDALGDWYNPFDMMLNDLGFWYPILLRSGVPTPRTVIVNTDSKAAPTWDPPEAFERTAPRILVAMDGMGYPCFFRGGQTSAKHDWNETCFVAARPTEGEVLDRMLRIWEICYTGNIGAEPLLYENWVVREIIPTTAVLTTRRGGMPVVTEMRFFLNDGSIACAHPYWPRKALEAEGSISDKEYDALCRISQEDANRVWGLALRVGKYFPGYWSCDFLKSSTGVWYCTDMAQGEDSYHDPDCSKNPGKNKRPS